MKRTYSAACYDDDLCLKAPVMLWIAIIFLSRSVAIPLLASLCSVAGVSAETVGLLRGLWSIDALLPSVFAGAVLISLVLRSPHAPQMARWIWARGKGLLMIAALLDIAVCAMKVLDKPAFNDQAILPLMIAGGDLYCLVYVTAARRVADTFADFPMPLLPATKRSR